MSFIHYPVKVTVGALSGTLAGALFILLLHVIFAGNAEEISASMVGLLFSAKADATTTTGWIYQMLFSAMLGGMAGWIFGNRMNTYRSAIGYGVLWAIACWCVSALLIPPMLEVSVAMLGALLFKSIVAYAIAGAAYGATFVWLVRLSDISDVSVQA